MKPCAQRSGGQAPCPILLVEDDPDVRQVLAEILTEEAFTVRTAQDGLEQHEAFAGLTVLVTTSFEGRIRDERVTQVLRKPYEIDELLRLLDVHCYPRSTQTRHADHLDDARLNEPTQETPLVSAQSPREWE